MPLPSSRTAQRSRLLPRFHWVVLALAATGCTSRQPVAVKPWNDCLSKELISACEKRWPLGDPGVDGGDMRRADWLKRLDPMLWSRLAWHRSQASGRTAFQEDLSCIEVVVTLSEAGTVHELMEFWFVPQTVSREADGIRTAGNLPLECLDDVANIEHVVSIEERTYAPPRYSDPAR